MFAPNKGGNVTGLLFELQEPFLAITLRNQIEFVINKYEPRVRVIHIKVHAEHDANTIRVEIAFRIVNIQEEQSLTLYLQRTR